MGIEKIGRYEILRELGRGGMATVYLARDPAFERQVAVKVLPPQLTRDTHYLSRFRREARVIAALEHPYIVPVYDYGEQGGQPYLVMRYMPAGTLANRTAGKPLPLETVTFIIARLAEALDEAHAHNVVHRDLKPTNVMFDARGQAYLSDFGVAKILEAAGAESLTGSSVIGTPAYMSPEQAVGDRQIDQRSDIYSLGVMIFEMLTGRQPYQADTPMRLLLKHVTEPVPQIDLSELARLGLPPELNAILARALAKKPEARYTTATQLVLPLQRLSGTPLAGGPGPLVSAARPARRRLEGSPKAAIDVESTTLAQPAEPMATRPARARPWRRVLLNGAGAVGAIALLALGVWIGQSVVAPTSTPTARASVTVTTNAAVLIVTLSRTPPASTATPSSSATATFTLPPPSVTVSPTVTATDTATRTVLPPTATRRPLPSPTPVPPTAASTSTSTEPPPPTAEPPRSTDTPPPTPIEP